MTLRKIRRLGNIGVPTPKSRGTGTPMPRSKIKSIVYVTIGVIGLVLFYFAVGRFDRAIGSALELSATKSGPQGASSLIELVEGVPNTIRLTEQGMKTVGSRRSRSSRPRRRSHCGCRDRCCWTRIGWCGFMPAFLASWFRVGHWIRRRRRADSATKSTEPADNCGLAIGSRRVRSSRWSGARTSARKRASWSTPFPNRRWTRRC